MKKLTPRMLTERNRIEAELAAIPPLTPAQRQLLSFDGFVDYFLTMRELYPSCLEAYENLDDIYEEVVGTRKYADFYSFKVQLSKYLKRTHQ